MGLQMLLLMLSSLSPCGKGKSKKEKKVQVTRKITHAKTKPNKSYKFFWTLEKKNRVPPSCMASFFTSPKTQTHLQLLI